MFLKDTLKAFDDFKSKEKKIYEVFQKFKNLGNGRGVVKNVYVEVMKTTVF